MRVPRAIDTAYQPPTALPLRHFLVGLGFLLLSGVVSVAIEADLVGPLAPVARLHLFLLGWICLTILGAMTQFVPVWSGRRLHSQRLARLQLLSVSVGVLGLAGGFLTGVFAAVSLFGTLLLVGFWLFVYNIARTLPPARSHDVTERHFALALAFFVLLTTLGWLLAVDLTTPLLASLGLERAHVVRSHATLAVFGAVLTTVLGALYQLAPMFTQTERHGVDHVLQRLEEWAYPTGVVCLAAGRLVAAPLAARFGAVLVLTGLLAFSLLLARRLYERTVDRTPMLTRYALATGSLLGWVVLTAPSWVDDPLAAGTTLGRPGTGDLLAVGVIGFVVVGTLYHVVPFIVWEHAYSDRLGFEPVPMLDDLYDRRLAVLDLAVLVVATACLVAADLSVAPGALGRVGSGLLVVGAAAVATNQLLVVRHCPEAVGEWAASVVPDGAGKPESVDS